MWHIMRTKLVVVFIFILCLCMSIILFSGTEKKPTEFQFLDRADSKESILFWWRNQRTGWGEPREDTGQVFEYNYDDNHAVVLLDDVASGVYCHNIYIYGKAKDMKEWRLILFRPTTTEVKVYQENDKLIFKTVTDDVILEQSFDALTPFGERVSQKLWD